MERLEPPAAEKWQELLFDRDEVEVPVWGLAATALLLSALLALGIWSAN